MTEIDPICVPVILIVVVIFAGCFVPLVKSDWLKLWIGISFILALASRPWIGVRHIAELIDNRYADAERVIGFILGWLLGLALCFLPVWIYLVCWCVTRKCEQNKASEAKADEARVAALDELEKGTMDRRLWARAIEEAGGDDARARSIYIRLRAHGK